MTLRLSSKRLEDYMTKINQQFDSRIEFFIINMNTWEGLSSVSQIWRSLIDQWTLTSEVGRKYRF